MFHKLVANFQGRHTLFLAFFAVTGFILALFGKLNTEYVALATALQGAALTHSWKQDKYPSA